MTTFMLRLITICAVLFLAGCKLDLPEIKSATVPIVQSTPVPKTILQTLSAEQIHALSTWFSVHASGWSSSLASYAKGTITRVVHIDGEVSYINILQSGVVIQKGKEQFYHGFSQEEISELRSILGLTI